MKKYYSAISSRFLAKNRTILSALALASFLVSSTAVLGMEGENECMEVENPKSTLKPLTLENGEVEQAQLIAALNKRRKKTDKLYVFQYDDERYFEVGVTSLQLFADFYTYEAQLKQEIMPELHSGKYVYKLTQDRRKLRTDSSFVAAQNTPGIILRLTPITQEEFESFPEVCNLQKPKDHLGRPIPNWVSPINELKTCTHFYYDTAFEGMEMYYNLGYKSCLSVHYPSRNIVYISTAQQFIDKFAGEKGSDFNEGSDFFSAALTHLSEIHDNYIEEYGDCARPRGIDMKSEIKLAYLDNYNYAIPQSIAPQPKLVSKLQNSPVE